MFEKCKLKISITAYKRSFRTKYANHLNYKKNYKVFFYVKKFDIWNLYKERKRNFQCKLT